MSEAPGPLVTGSRQTEEDTVSPLIVTEPRDALLARRREILEALGLSMEDFRTLSQTRTLTGEEREAREELDEIAFLLGDD
jgi:hypothetical protein